jgi:hypothetical protein
MPRRFGTRRALLKSQTVWTPRQLSGLTAWYDSQEITTLFQDSALTTPAGNGDVIGGWVDKGGNGYAMTQGTTANKPTMTINSINGIAAPVFDGGDYLTNGPLGALFSGSDVPFSVWVVAKHSTVAAYQRPWNFCNSGNEFPFHSHLLHITAPEFRSYREDDAPAAKFGSGGTPTTSPYIAGHIFTGTLGTLIINGIAVDTDFDIDLGTATFDRFSVGGKASTSLSNAMQGAIGELVVVNRTINSVEAGQLSRYMGYKWGISVS